VAQGKEHEVYGGEGRPTAGDEELFEVGVVGFKHNACALSEVVHAGCEHGEHENARDDDFVCGDGDDVGEEDDAGETKGEGEGVESLNDPEGEAFIGDGDVGDEPDGDTCGKSEDDGSPEDEESAVDERRVERFPKSGRAVGGEF